MKKIGKSKCSFLAASLAIMATFFLVSPCLSADEKEAPKPVIKTTGTGDRYQTTVERKSVGTLKPEDFRQASVLGSRVLAHLENAENNLMDAQMDEARRELEHARSLAGVIRDLLPVTIVSTRVHDAEGKEIYAYEDRVQDDRIPIYEGLISLEVVQPIIDLRKEDAAVKGVRLADANVLHTSVLMDLSYIDRKIRQCLAETADSKKALAVLAQARRRGVDFSINEKDGPLYKAQAATRLAERQVEDGRLEGAKANLQIATLHLQTYRSMLGAKAGKEVENLENKIGDLRGRLHENGSAETLRSYWSRMAQWFQPQAEEARQTTEDG